MESNLTIVNNIAYQAATIFLKSYITVVDHRIGAVNILLLLVVVPQKIHHALSLVPSLLHSTAKESYCFKKGLLFIIIMSIRRDAVHEKFLPPRPVPVVGS